MSFDLLAPHYRWMEFILAGEKLQRCRAAFLDQVPVPRRILLVGEGPGRCLIECAQRFPTARITIVDASERMLAMARRHLQRRLPEVPEVNYRHLDVSTELSVDGDYDLIVTHFFLDCFRADQLERIVPRLAACATPTANWLIADFQNARGGFPRVRSRLILWAMYGFFRVVTRLPARKLIEPSGYLERAGFRLRQRVEAEWGLLRSDWWQRRSADFSPQGCPSGVARRDFQRFNCSHDPAG